MIPVVNKEVTGKPERSGGFLMFGRKYDEWLKAFTFIAAAPVEACIIGDGKNPIPPPSKPPRSSRKPRGATARASSLRLSTTMTARAPRLLSRASASSRSCA